MRDKMKEQLKMKHIRRLVALISITLVVCLCLSGCDDDSSSQGVLDVLFQQNDSGGQTSYVTTTISDDEQVMLLFRVEPSIQSENAKDKVVPTEYKVYFSGRVTDEKSGKQSNITGAELDKLKKYSQDILDHKIESKFEGGDPDTDTTVAAYDKTIKNNQLTAQSKCCIDNFDEMYKIVADKYKG